MCIYSTDLQINYMYFRSKFSILFDSLLIRYLENRLIVQLLSNYKLKIKRINKISV